MSVALFLDWDLKCQKATTWRHSHSEHPPIKRWFYYPDVCPAFEWFAIVNFLAPHVGRFILFFFNKKPRMAQSKKSNLSD